MRDRATVVIQGGRIETFFRGSLLASYPRRVWEVSRVEGDTVFWSSRERTDGEMLRLFHSLHQKIRKRGGSGMEVKVIQSPEEEGATLEEAA
jgi:hypothetical protein